MTGALTVLKFLSLSALDWIDVRVRRSEERWRSECYYCGHTVKTRSMNMATLKMCVHMGFEDDHPDNPERVDDDLYAEVDHVFGPVPVEVD